MKGDDFSGLLEDYHYGELDDVTAARLMAHLRGCGDCSSALAEIEQENQVYQAYADSMERELDVTPAMWEGVRTRLNEAPSVTSAQPGLLTRLGQSLSVIFASFSPAMRQVAFAAVIVVISVSGTLLVVKMMGNKQQSTIAEQTPQKPVLPPESPKQVPTTSNPDLVATDKTNKQQELPKPKRQQEKATEKDSFINVDAKNADPSQIALEQRIQKLRKEYVEAIDILSTSVNKRKSKLDPKLLAVFNRNLNIVNETIAATRKAYTANPTDAELAQYMLTAYAKKVELLQEIDSAIASN